MPFCAACGGGHPEPARHCPWCGAAVAPASPALQPPPQPVARVVRRQLVAALAGTAALLAFIAAALNDIVHGPPAYDLDFSPLLIGPMLVLAAGLVLGAALLVVASWGLLRGRRWGLALSRLVWTVGMLPWVLSILFVPVALVNVLMLRELARPELRAWFGEVPPGTTRSP